jgi:hypothetical protein
MRRAQRAPAARAFHLDFSAPRRRHSDAAKYIAIVFWTAGYSASTIANIMGLRRAQALALVQKAGVIERATAADDERRRLLQELKEIRFEDGAALDGGVLDRFEWQIVPLADGRKRRPARRAS